MRCWIRDWYNEGGIRNVECGNVRQRELKAEVGVWKVEILKVEMMKIVDERADLTK